MYLIVKSLIISVKIVINYMYISFEKIQKIFISNFKCTVTLNGEEMTETQKAGDIVVTITRKIEGGNLLSVSIISVNGHRNIPVWNFGNFKSTHLVTSQCIAIATSK